MVSSRKYRFGPVLIIAFFLAPGLQLCAQQQADAVLSKIRAAGSYYRLPGDITGLVDSFYQAPAAAAIAQEIQTLGRNGSDTALAVRAAVYYMAGKLSGQCEALPQDSRTPLLQLLSKGASDRNRAIRDNALNYLVDNTCWHTGIARDREILQSFTQLISQYGNDIPLGLFRIMAENQLSELAPVLKRTFYSKAAASPLSGADLYDSKSWAALFTLARLGDAQSLDLIIAKLSKEEILELKYREIANMCLLLQNKKVIAFAYKTVMSKEVETKMEPVGKGDSYAPTYFAYFLLEQVPVVFKGFPAAALEELKIKNSGDTELDAKLLAFTRNWLKDNRQRFL